MARDQSARMSKKDKPWLCKCGFLLGIVSPDKNTLRIKYKDLYIAIEGKDVKVTELCRRCAIPNVLTSGEDLPEVPPESKEGSEEPVVEKAEEGDKKST